MSDQLSLAAGMLALAASLFVATAAQATSYATAPYDRETTLYAHTAPEIKPSQIYGRHDNNDSIWPTESTAPRSTSATLPNVAPYVKGKTTFPWGDAWPFSALDK